MRVTFNYCNLACYVYENKAIYNHVNGSQFPESDLHVLQSCSNAFSFFSLPTSYCNVSEKSYSFNRPFHMVIVNMIVANKSYSNVFVIRVLGPCGSLTLTELICQSCQLTARQR